jgi:flagellar hook protein FlgE
LWKYRSKVITKRLELHCNFIGIQLKKLKGGGNIMLRSLYAGISGMKANQVKLDVIGNNIANVGTTAFKGSRVRFQDMVSQSMSQALAPGTNLGGVNPKQVGLGVQVAGIDTLMGQGMMQPTSRNLDVAMDGEGYLMVARGAIDGTIALADNHTVAVDDAAAGEEAKTMSPFYTRDGALTLDNEGNLLTSDGFRVMGYAISAGAEGSLSHVTDTETNKTTAKVIKVDVNGTAPLVTDNILRALAIPDKIFADAADTVGQRVRTFSIEKDGVIKAVLEDGTVSAVGQIAVAAFNNPAGLSKLGKNLYQNTSNSGEPVFRSGIDTDPASTAKDNGMGYGDMLQGMLEMSNVDLAEQFTDMIVASRAFQAVGKTITTGDEILQDIIGLKR